MRLGDRIFVFLAEGLGIGRMPFAPGTFGTVLGIGWVWLLSFFCSTIPLFFAATVAGVLAAIWIGQRAEIALEKKDPGQIVIDEIMVMPIAFAPAVMGAGGMNWQILSQANGPDWLRIVIIFGLFRLFDVWKPWPVRQIQDLKGGVGLVLDDVLAAVYAALALMALDRFF